MRTKTHPLNTRSLTSLIAASLLTYGTVSHAATTEVQKGKGSKQMPAIVDTPTSVNLGALLGVGFLNNDFGNQLVIGVDGAYQMRRDLQVGGYLTYNSVSQIAGITSSLFTIAPEASYILRDVGFLSGLRAGGKAGLGIVSVGSGTTTIANTSVTVEGDTNLSFVIGPHVGYDIGLSPTLSLGAEGNYLIYTSNEGFNAFNLLSAFKIHL